MKAFCAEKCLAGEDPCSWLNLLKQGKFREAWLEIMEFNPLPAVIGRVCPYPCEDACKRVLLDEAISINKLEGYLGELAIVNGWRPAVSGDKVKSRSVAVVGSGPAGLSCAYQLARRRYRVDIFEALPVLGGMLRVGIPDFRLPKDILDKEIDNILYLGVGIHKNIIVDSKLLEHLKDSYGAVFFAIGLQKSRKLNIKGEKNHGVLYGLDFLKDINLGKRTSLGRKGKKVIIIGGGNTAIDAARAAQRLGSEVSIFYRRSKAEMPALKTEILQAMAEGIKIQELVLPIQILKKTVELQRVKLGETDETGRRKPMALEGTNFQEGFDNLIIAVGEEMDSSLGLKSETRGTVAEAIKLGREAAEKIIQTLEPKPGKSRLVLPRDPDFYLTPKKRIEISSSTLARKEAQRCLGCGFEVEGLAEVLINEVRCKGCGLCVDVCPYRVLELSDSFNSQGYRPACAKNSKKCRGCTWCNLICPDAAIEVKREV